MYGEKRRTYLVSVMARVRVSVMARARVRVRVRVGVGVRAGVTVRTMDRVRARVIVVDVLGREGAQVLAHVLLLRDREQRGRPRPPEQLVELVLPLVLELPALRGPHVVAVLHLVPPVRDRGGDEAAGGVPLDVGAHEVLGLADGLHRVDVDPLELAARALEVGHQDDGARGRPEEERGRLVRVRARARVRVRV